MYRTLHDVAIFLRHVIHVGALWFKEKTNIYFQVFLAIYDGQWLLKVAAK